MAGSGGLRVNPSVRISLFTVREHIANLSSEHAKSLKKLSECNEVLLKPARLTENKCIADPERSSEGGYGA